MTQSTHRPPAHNPAAQHPPAHTPTAQHPPAHTPTAHTPTAQHPPAHTPTAQTVGVFTIEYTLFTNATPGHDIQFGMDSSLTSTVKKPLSQLIFPAVAVGTNRPGMWNIDNYNSGNGPASLIFSNAEHGTITDKPREITAPHQGVKTTKFAVYLVDLQTGTVQSTGVQFGYSINTSDTTPRTIFTGFTKSNIANEQKALMQARFNHINFA